jgi:hypothetical protein
MIISSWRSPSAISTAQAPERRTRVDIPVHKITDMTATSPSTGDCALSKCGAGGHKGVKAARLVGKCARGGMVFPQFPTCAWNDIQDLAGLLGLAAGKMRKGRGGRVVEGSWYFPVVVVAN